MLRIRFLLVALIAVQFGLRLEAKGQDSYYGCPNYGSELSLEFRGELLLNSEFMTDRSEASLKAAIHHQIKYIRGYYINNRNSFAYSLTVNSESPKIEILSMTDAAYKKDLFIDTIVHPGVKVTEPYILKAMTRKMTRKSDKGILVTFKASVDSYFCGPESSISEIQVPLVSDPYLLYWNVAPKNRRDIRWRHAEFKMNPCADSEYADIPDPTYYWYFWNPSLMGSDKHSKAFNCKKMLPQGTSYQLARTKALVKKSSPARAAISANSTTIRASIIFGVIDETGFIFPWKQALSTLDQISGRQLSDVRVIASDLSKRPPSTELDRGSQYLLNFLRDLNKVMHVGAVVVSKDDGTLEFSGSLVRGGKPAVISLWFGYTDVLGLKSPEHWQFLKKSMMTSEYILYNGHSGLGQNMSIENMLSATGDTAEKVFANAPKSQFIAYFSCYSYGYFGDDFVSYRKAANPSNMTHVLLTGTEFTSERGPLGILEQLGENIAGLQTNVGRSSWLHSHDQLIIKSFSENVTKGPK